MKILNFQQYIANHSVFWLFLLFVAVAVLCTAAISVSHIVTLRVRFVCSFFHFIHHWILSEHLFNAHTFCCDRICLFRFEFAFIKFSIRCYDHYNSIFLSLSRRVNNFHFVICTYIRYMHAILVDIHFSGLVFIFIDFFDFSQCNASKSVRSAVDFNLEHLYREHLLTLA